MKSFESVQHLSDDQLMMKARALNSLGFLSYFRGELDESESCFTKCQLVLSSLEKSNSEAIKKVGHPCSTHR